MVDKARAMPQGKYYTPNDNEVMGIISEYFGIQTKVTLKAVVVLADEMKTEAKSLFDLV